MAVQEESDNISRVNRSKEDAKTCGEDKTAILFSTSHKAGALADVLEVFKRTGINLTNIESRPSKKREWEYYFFMDFLGHRTDENVVNGLAEAAEQLCALLRQSGLEPPSLRDLATRLDLTPERTRSRVSGSASSRNIQRTNTAQRPSKSSSRAWMFSPFS